MNKLLHILLLLPVLCFCQQVEFKGRVVANGSPLSNVYVINATQKIETRTTGGNFTISAKPGDMLIVHHPNITSREFTLSEASFKEQPYIITVNVTAYEMNELLINHEKPVDEVSLGLVPEDQLQLTPAERKYKAAASMRPTLISGIGVPFDPIINAITGRSKMLKKALATERKETLLQKESSMYTKNELMTELKIPEEYIDGFLYYATQDPGVAKALNENNYDEAKRLTKMLVLQYLQNIQGQ